MALINVDLEKLAALKADQVAASRKAAYAEEADPLFFKYQRGEATQQEWLDKIAEIRSRFPDPVSPQN